MNKYDIPIPSILIEQRDDGMFEASISSCGIVVAAKTVDSAAQECEDAYVNYVLSLGSDVSGFSVSDA